MRGSIPERVGEIRKKWEGKCCSTGAKFPSGPNEEVAGTRKFEAAKQTVFPLI